MYKGRILATNMAAATDIPFTTILNTNGSLSANNGIVTFLASGVYEVKGILNITGITGSISAMVMDGSTAIADTVVGATAAATTDLIALPVYGVVNVKQQDQSVNAQISIQLSAAATITDASFVVTRIA